MIDTFDTEDSSIWYDATRRRFYAIFHAHDHIGLITSPNGYEWSKAKQYRVCSKQILFVGGNSWQPDRLERPSVLTDVAGQPLTLFLAAKKGDRSFNIHLPIQTP